MTDQETRLEYFRLLRDRSFACQAAFKSAVKHFYLSALVLFVLLGFQPAELTVFGATFPLPRTLLAVVGPLVLGFLFLRIASLFEAQTGYSRAANESAVQVFDAQGRELTLKEVNRVTESAFWFQPMWDIEVEHHTRPMGVVTLILWIGMLGAIYVFPVLLIGYAVWLLWQQSTPIVSVTVSIAAALLSISALIVAFGGGLGKLLKAIAAKEEQS